MTNMQIKPADRIAPFKPYFFATLNQKISQLKTNGVDVIRIDMGSPDLPPTDEIIEEMIAAARRPDMHGYSPMGGTLEFRKAATLYYLRRFGVELDPQTEVLGLLGSKEGVFHLGQVLLNPGDLALVPDPGYPVYRASCEIAGAEVFTMPLLEKNGFLLDLAAIPTDVADRAKLMWLNYPNNPTGAVASIAFFQDVIAFAREHSIFVAHDNPYADVCFDGYVAPSLLEVPGAREICVEFNSLSKTFNMAGWRVGMAVGNSQILGYLHTYKSQLDSSTFTPLLTAGAKALTGDQEWIQERNQIYLERRDIVVSALKKAGLRVTTPPAAIYVWARIPSGEESTAFCTRLLEETGVSVTPGTVYGEYGEGYLRISLGTETSRMKEAMRRLVDWMKGRNASFEWQKS
ncbi:MAG TPA: aminotransferase class I/II-fold pyridoxal phosphate-dependent enzyme [Anaerolineaceae bacterium]|nr:aminotransferase class I/II-fold pyridoxal phosphate-dependent enzyme [Anaerolineaceae bacterium]